MPRNRIPRSALKGPARLAALLLVVTTLIFWARRGERPQPQPPADDSLRITPFWETDSAAVSSPRRVRGSHRAPRQREWGRSSRRGTTNDKPAADEHERFPKKFTALQLVNLNRADSLTLLRVPDIGPYRAHRILRYGQRLGGYISPQQLHEIEGLPAEVVRWFTVDSTAQPHPLRLNELEFGQLLSHPYLNYAQVRAIVNHRRRYGKVDNLQQLSNDTAFTQNDLDKLKPYVDLE